MFYGICEASFYVSTKCTYTDHVSMIGRKTQLIRLIFWKEIKKFRKIFIFSNVCNVTNPPKNLPASSLISIKDGPNLATYLKTLVNSFERRYER